MRKGSIKTLSSLLLATFMTLGLAACGTGTGERAASGAGVGAAVGAGAAVTVFLDTALFLGLVAHDRSCRAQ